MVINLYEMEKILAEKEESNWAKMMFQPPNAMS
jgi:hypothetical protein